MSREIKFRAWHTEQKRMFEVYGLGQDFVTENTLDGVDPGNNAFMGDAMQFINVMQFTGLKDKNGTEIYEGDIISVKEFKNELLAIKDMPNDEMKAMREGLSLDEIKGEMRKEYVSDVIWEDGAFIIKSGREDYDMWFSCLYCDMKGCSPIFEFEIIGNIHQNHELLKGVSNG